jgi:integrase
MLQPISLPCTQTTHSEAGPQPSQARKRAETLEPVRPIARPREELVVSQALGHSTIRITADTYAHVTPAMQQSAAERLDRMIGASYKTS